MNKKIILYGVSSILGSGYLNPIIKFEASTEEDAIKHLLSMRKELSDPYDLVLNKYEGYKRKIRNGEVLCIQKSLPVKQYLEGGEES